MLRITKEADYGIMLLVSMASRPQGEIHTARQAAEWTGLPLPMVSKILRTLARERILASHRGVSGGYSLNRPPDETSVAAVIRALEGPISMVQCGSEPGACVQEAVCPTRINWSRISHEVERALEQVPISDMISQAPAGELLTLDGDDANAGAGANVADVSSSDGEKR
jgi:FeS assembly SUF system regulator